MSEAAAKERAVSMSQNEAGAVFQVRYRVNANGRTEIRWEAIGGRIDEVTGDARTHR